MRMINRMHRMMMSPPMTIADPTMREDRMVVMVPSPSGSQGREEDESPGGEEETVVLMAMT